MYKNNEAIKHVIDYFENQKTLISEVKPIIYRKIVYVTALDTLARAAFGNGSSNNERYIKMLKNLTSWQYMDYVSLPQLYMAIENNKSCDLRKDDLYKEVKNQLSKWSRGQILSIDNPPKFSVLEQFCKRDCEKNFLKKAQYAELFYTYRNNLVHEFHEPGQGLDFMSSIKNQPFYHQNTPKLNNPTHKIWELVFPVGFFAYIYEEALAGLEKYLNDNNINPLDHFKHNSIWE